MIADISELWEWLFGVTRQYNDCVFCARTLLHALYNHVIPRHGEYKDTDCAYTSTQII